VAPPQRVDQDVDRPLVPDLTQRVNRRRRDALVRIAQDEPDEPRHGRMVRALEALKCVHPSPAAPVRAWPSSHASHKALGGARAQRGRCGLVPSAVVQEAADEDR
jgi:hypothetical protein